MNFRFVARAVLLAALAVSSTLLVLPGRRKRRVPEEVTLISLCRARPLAVPPARRLRGQGLDRLFQRGAPRERLSTSASVDRRRFAPVQFGFDSYTVSSSELGKVQVSGKCNEAFFGILDHCRVSG
jgi:hypothetical protein